MKQIDQRRRYILVLAGVAAGILIIGGALRPGPRDEAESVAVRSPSEGPFLQRMTLRRSVDDLAIRYGEHVAIVGPSGSGKSTLLQILGCLDTPTAGSYRLDGEPVVDLSESRLAEVRNQKIGFVFQGFHLLPRATARRNVELPLVYAGVPSAERRARAETELQRVGLGDRMNHRPSELSGGQRQRVAIARALVTNPAILLADEPTGNLDSQTGAEILDLFDALRSPQRALIMVTHDRALANRALRLVALRDGRIEYDGVPAECPTDLLHA